MLLQEQVRARNYSLVARKTRGDRQGRPLARCHTCFTFVCDRPPLAPGTAFLELKFRTDKDLPFFGALADQIVAGHAR